MKDIPLDKAMFAWNLGKDSFHKPEGYVGVCAHPCAGQLPKTDRWLAPHNALPRESITATETKLLLKLQLMIEAWHLACRDEVPLANVHAAFKAIPEYRDMLSEDFRVAASNTPT